MDPSIKLEPKASPVEISDQRSARGNVNLEVRGDVDKNSRIPRRHHVCRPPEWPPSPSAHPMPWPWPMAPCQIRPGPLKRVTDGIEKSNGISLDFGAVLLISWQRPASAISPRACFDLTGAHFHICTMAVSSR